MLKILRFIPTLPMHQRPRFVAEYINRRLVDRTKPLPEHVIWLLHFGF